MAQIPTYTPAEQPEAVPAFRQNIEANPADFGANIGQAASETGAQGVDLATHIMRMENYTKVTQARLQFETGVDNEAQTNWYTKKNNDAAGLPQQSAAYINQARQDAIQGMNPLQQRMFDQQTLRYVKSTQFAVERHARQEHFNFANATAEQGINGDVQQAAGSFTDDSIVDNAYNHLQTDVAASNSLNGRVGVDADEYELKQTTKFHMSVVDAYLSHQDPIGAKRYFDNNTEEIDPTIHTQAAKSLNAEALSAQADNTAEDLAQKHQGQVADPVPGIGPDPKSGVSTGVLQRVPSDWAGAKDEANNIADPKLRQQVLQRLDKKDADQRELFKADDARGALNLSNWYAQNPGKTFLDVDAGTANKLGLGGATYQSIQTKQQEFQIAEQKKEEAAKSAEEYKATALDGALTARKEVFGQAMAYDPTNDPDKTKLLDIEDGISKMLSLNQKSGAPAADMDKPIRDVLNSKLNPDKALPPEVKQYLKWNGPNQKPGGLEAQILDDVKAANLASRDGWIFKGPAALDKAAPTIPSDVKVGATKPTAYPIEVYQYAATLAKQVEAAAIKNKWGVAEIEEHYKTDPQFTRLRTTALMSKWAAQLHSGGSRSLPAPAKVASADLDGNN